MEKIAVIGAGLVGSLQAIYLAKKGYQVDVYEGRADMRKQKMSAGRSINLALSNRGWKALEIVGIKEKIEKMAIPMYGRMIHNLDEKPIFQPYGKENQAIYSVSRGGLNRALMESADSFENVNFHFEHKCLDVDLNKNLLEFETQRASTVKTAQADRIFATDGAFSAIRGRLQKTDRFNFQQFYLEHGYKELSIPPAKDGSHLIDKNALHIWPRGNYMLIALANEDGSFTCTLFFPFEGKPSFNSLKSSSEVESFFKSVFPDAFALMPDLKNDYFKNPTSSLVTIRCSPWNYKDQILLMGDASHAIVPFYGQGMNSGFEDCSVFNSIFEKCDQNFELAFSEFSQNRKKDADAISDLALQNFIEMRDLVGDRQFLLRKKIEKKMHQKYPNRWVPLYTQVTFSHIPYSEALSAGKKQDNIMDCIMAKNNIESVWDSPEIEQEILKMVADD